MKVKEYEYLIDALKSLPTVSTKSANRIANHLINSDKEYFNELVNRMIEAKTRIRFCQYCNNMVVNSFSCDICKNTERHNRKLCIVSSIDDLYKIESSESFYGTYFILKSELDYKKKESVKNMNLEQLEQTINNFNINEILIATNMTTNGELTAKYIKNYLNQKSFNIEFFRLALGIPLNASIDYIDWESLKFSIKNKTKME